MTIQTTRYYRSLLNTNDQALYDALYDAWKNFLPSVTLRCRSSEKLHKLLLYISLDNPLMFYVNFYSVNYSYQPLIGIMVVKMEYLFSYSEAKLLISEVEQKSNEIISKLNICHSGSTAYQKALLIHDWMTTNIEYSDNVSRLYMQHSLIGSLITNQSVCDGYAKMYKILCEMVGVTCIIVTGIGKTSQGSEEHAWNILRLDDFCAHVDVTWDSNYTKSFYNNNNYSAHDFFLQSDSEAIKTHSWDIQTIPKCDEKNFKGYFEQNGMIAKSTEQIFALCKKNVENGIFVFQIKLISRRWSRLEIENEIQRAIIVSRIINRGYRGIYRYTINVECGILSIAFE